MGTCYKQVRSESRWNRRGKEKISGYYRVNTAVRPTLIVEASTETERAPEITVPAVPGETVDLREVARVSRDLRSGVEILEPKSG